MKTYILTLTHEQIEILGYALTITMRRERAKAIEAKEGGRNVVWQGCVDRLNRIEHMRDLLDACPETVSCTQAECAR